MSNLLFLYFLYKLHHFLLGQLRVNKAIKAQWQSWFVKRYRCNSQVTEKLDRSNNRVSGKRKRGAQWLNPSSPLCLIYCSDGSQYTVYCGVRASLVEMNDRLLSNPDLLLRRYKTEGYVFALSYF